jgi:superfamily I DNA and/or RNA helicase
MEPKVMVVEEAGQVLESHILASLVESVQHVIMIGDPLQLRPSVNSYSELTINRVFNKLIPTPVCRTCHGQPNYWPDISI